MGTERLCKTKGGEKMMEGKKGVGERGAEIW